MATIKQREDASGKPIPGQWRAQIRVKGWPHLTRTFLTKKEAEFWANETEVAMKKGTWVDGAPARSITLAQHIQAYIENVTELRTGKASIAAEKSRLQRFMRDEPDLCAHALANLTSEMFETYRKERLKQHATRGQENGRGRYKPQIGFKTKTKKDGTPRANAAKPKAPPKPPKLISPGTVKKELNTLMRVLKYRRHETGLAINPLDPDRVKRPAVKDERWIRLDPDLIRRVIEECYKSENPLLGPIVEFALETGQRRGSLLNLHWSDIAHHNREALIRNAKDSKNSEEERTYRIGLSKKALAILEALPRGTENDGPVFPMTIDALKSAFNRARMRAKAEFFRFHDTRHERAASLIEAGLSDVAVMSQVGFQDPKTLKRYANLRPLWLADQLDNIDVLGSSETTDQKMERLEKEIAEAQAKLAAMKQAQAAKETV